MLLGCHPEGSGEAALCGVISLGCSTLEWWEIFLWLWGPLLVGGAALNLMVSQCCPSEVQAPVTTTELSWVVTLLWEQETQESFPAP